MNLTRRNLLLATFGVNLLQHSGCAKANRAAPAENDGSSTANAQGSSVTTRATVGASSLKGENVGGGTYWTAHDIYIDWFDNAAPSLPGKFIDPVTGDVNLPTGESWTAIIRETFLRGTPSHVKLRPGKVRVWWSGTATVAEIGISVDGGLKVADAGSQAIEITIPPEAEQGGGAILFQFGNNSGTAKTLIKPHAVYVDDMKAFESGEIFDPRHLASYPPDIGIIRVPHTSFVHMLEGLENKLDAELTYEHLIAPSTNHFHRHRNYQTAARLAQKLGPDVALWINANVMMDRAGYARMASEIAATGFAGKLVLEVGLEFWNFAYPYVMQRVRAREVIAPKIRVVDRNGNRSSEEGHVDACCYAEKSMQLWDAFAEHFPQQRLIRVLTGQSTWFDVMSPMFAYRRDGEGPRCGEIYDANAIAGYVDWTNTEEMWGSGAQNFSPAQWDAEMEKRLKLITDRIDAYKAEALQSQWSKNPNYMMYEGWHHLAVYDTYNVGKASGGEGQGTLTFESSIAGRLSTGDFLYSNVAWNWVSSWGSPWPTDGAFARVVDATHVTLHPTAEDARANRNPLKLNRAISDATCTNRGRSKQISDSIMAWLHSTHGVAFSDRWWSQMKPRFNSYRIIFEPKQNGSDINNMWGFYPPPANLHNPPGLILSWWRGVSDA